MSIQRTVLLASMAIALGMLIATCRQDFRPTSPAQSAPRFSADIGTTQAVLVGAGDIARCDKATDEATAGILDTIAGTVFTAGDNVYVDGSSSDFTNCYGPSWGRHKARTYPAAGDKDYVTTGAAGYFGYFGAAAGDPTKGYYSYNLGSWHVVVLNSNIDMSAGGVQEQWLRTDLAANPTQCTVAYWHHPRFYSGSGTPRASVLPLWNALYAAGADLVLNGHTRNYERFAPQAPDGTADTTYGIREIIVGTGGIDRVTPGTATATSAPATTTATAQNFPPALDAGPDVRTHPSETVQLALLFSDPGSDAPWSYAVAWGDGTTSTGSTTSKTAAIAVSHSYASTGLDSVRVTLTDAGGAGTADSLAVYVEAPGTPEVFVSAGDIATCANTNAEATAKLLDAIPGSVFTLGDNAYPMGAAADYTNCYNPTWGRHRDRTRASLGNHEYAIKGAAATYDYFGLRVGPRGLGYYSYDLGDWHIVVLNDNLSGSAFATQVSWLTSDLAASTKQCQLAIWHQPLFFSPNSSGVGAPTANRQLWTRLYAAGADLILNGHQHLYERFAPQTPDSVADPALGIRE